MNTETHSSRKDRLEKWLEKNVLVPPRPEKITISNLQFNWDSLAGTFQLSLDNVVIKEPLDLRVCINGKIVITPPMFHSPLGVPCSYATLVLDEATVQAITQTLQAVFPQIRAFGWHKELDLIIDGFSPFEERIVDLDDFNNKVAALAAKGLTLTATVPRA
jgi:hypothetical protein